MRTLAVAAFILLTFAVCTFTASADDLDNPYVVNTNWAIDPETGVGSFRPGYGVDPDPGRVDYLPAYNDYDWMYTDNRGVRNDTLQDLLLSWEPYCRPEINGVDVLNRIGDLQLGINRIQIVVNHVMPDGGEALPLKSAFTIFFPPNFSIDTANRYPVVINGTGYGSKGLNSGIFSGLPVGLTTVKDTYLFDQNSRGIVFVRWNTGGFHSLGVNDEALEALNALIQMLHNTYGCDKDKIITIGSSRAGFAALTLAENIAHQTYDYTVVGVFSKVSPLSLGKLSEVPVSTFPAFASTYNFNVGPGAFRYSYTPPGAMNPDILLPAFGPEVDGTPLVQKADQMSPDGSGNLQALQGKYIFLCYASHDCFFPLNHFLDLDNWLSNNGLEHTSCITLQGGHASSANDVTNMIFKDFIDYLLNDENFVPGEYSPPNWKHGLYENGRNYFLDADITWHGEEVLPLDLDELPFSVTLPYRLGCNVFGDGSPGLANEPGMLFLTGAAGKSWEISVRRREPDGSYGEPCTWSGTFDHSETDIIKWWPGRTGWDGFPVYASGAGWATHLDNDWLEWTAIYDGIDYTNYTNFILGGERIAMETEITSNQSWTDALLVNYGYGEGDGNTGFGIDSIPALPWVDLSCTPASGTAPVEITWSLTAGCYAPADRVLAYSVDITMADGTLLPGHWQGTMDLGPDQSETHFQLYDYTDAGSIGVNTFDVMVTDVTPAPFNQPPFPPSGLSNSTKAIVNIAAPISDPVRLQQWLFNWKQGWTSQGDWDLGVPAGAGGEFGGPDPDSGWTGTKAFGYNLDGDYPNNLLGADLISPVFDCSDSTETRLKFRRWLGVEDPAHDHAFIRVSADGGPWVTVWQNETEIVDSSWVAMDIDISAVADGRSNVQLRWTMGPTNSTNTYCGWNIDDVEVWCKKSIVPTIVDDLTCIPSTGTLPFATRIKYTISNTCDSYRTVASQVDLELASGNHIANWRRGYQNISPHVSNVTQWNQILPALGTLVGENIFTFMSRDVTPEPYNQPPHAPSGSTNGDTCVVVGN